MSVKRSGIVRGGIVRVPFSVIRKAMDIPDHVDLVEVELGDALNWLDVKITGADCPLVGDGVHWSHIIPCFNWKGEYIGWEYDGVVAPGVEPYLPADPSVEFIREAMSRDGTPIPAHLLRKPEEQCANE